MSSHRDWRWGEFRGISAAFMNLAMAGQTVGGIMQGSWPFLRASSGMVPELWSSRLVMGGLRTWESVFAFQVGGREWAPGAGLSRLFGVVLGQDGVGQELVD